MSRDDREIRDEVRRIRERVKGLSGFWIGEASAAIYALEWSLGKREKPPSEDLGRAGGEQGRIAAGLVKLAEKAPRPRPAVRKPARLPAAAAPSAHPAARPPRARSGRAKAGTRR
jgi:hypothetical protein